MIKAIHIGRSVNSAAEFRSLAEVLNALGFDRESATSGGRSQAESWVAPAGKLSLGLKGAGDLRGRAEGTDLLLEVTDPNAVYAVLEKRGLKFIADHHEGSSTSPSSRIPTASPSATPPSSSTALTKMAARRKTFTR